MERELILAKLLDKYENSKHLSEPKTSRRRVMLRIVKNDLPEYTFEIAEVRDRFNGAARVLEAEGIIEVIMLSDRPVISSIVLNLMKISDAYKAANRTHPSQAADKCISMIASALSAVGTPWIQSWRDDVCETARQTMRLPVFYKKGATYAREFLSVLAYYDRLNGATITTRAFSIACLQNSKRFEKEFQDEFLRAAMCFHPEIAEVSLQEDFGTREKLAVLGIYTHPELYQLSGHISIVTRHGETALSPVYPHGMAIPESVLDDIMSFKLGDIRRIVFIENLTNYYEYLHMEVAPEELVIFHGGYLSPKKRQFLHKLLEPVPPEFEVFFWGDVDLGGFKMFGHLQKIFPELRPMRMSADIVEKYAQFGLVREPAYLERLETANRLDEFPHFKESIRMILHYGVTIEQEVFLHLPKGSYSMIDQ